MPRTRRVSNAGAGKASGRVFRRCGKRADGNVRKENRPMIPGLYVFEGVGSIFSTPSLVRVLVPPQRKQCRTLYDVRFVSIFRVDVFCIENMIFVLNIVMYIII